MSEGTQRRLAAILAADVVGYSRLMSEDESGTLGALRYLRREVFEPTVREYQGTLVKSMGDGWLVEFASVADSVGCAIRVQEALADHERIKLRVGLHVGDVTFEDEDIYGDGVNVASRLQELADPGAIVISAAARSGIDQNLSAGFADLGAHDLKNIPEPVPAFGWGMSEVSGKSKGLVLPDKPSIVVLPFDNMSGDPEQEYIADGIVEELTSALSRIHNLFVIARNTAFTFKGRPKNIREIAQELGVRYVLEGSVRRGGDKLRVTVQLIEGTDASHIWANNFDSTLKDIFELQDAMTMAIVGQIHPTIRAEEIRRSRRRRPSDMRAYDYVMQAFPLAWSLEKSSNETARNLLETAIAIDPEYAFAYAILSWCEGQRIVYQWTDDRAPVSKRCLKLARKAYELDPKDPTVLTGLATAQTFADQLDEALDNLDRALVIDPNSAWAWSRHGWAQYYLGNVASGRESFRKALQISPLDPMNFNCYIGLGAVETAAGNHQQAINYIERGLRERPEATWANRILSCCYALNGQPDKAKACVERLLEIYPDLTTEKVISAFPLRSQAYIAQYRRGLKLAGLPE
jgi:adenylate cyclase